MKRSGAKQRKQECRTASSRPRVGRRGAAVLALLRDDVVVHGGLWLQGVHDGDSFAGRGSELRQSGSTLLTSAARTTSLRGGSIFDDGASPSPPFLLFSRTGVRRRNWGKSPLRWPDSGARLRSGLRWLWLPAVLPQPLPAVAPFSLSSLPSSTPVVVADFGKSSPGGLVRKAGAVGNL